MEEVPLSLLLESLIHQEQIDWLEIPSSESSSLENNLPIVSQNISSGSQSFHSSPDLAFVNVQNGNEDESGENRSSEEDSQEDGTRNPPNKRKRRERKTECEAKRRNKFNEQIAALRTILYGEVQEKSKNAPKITREALLGSAIQEIAKLRQELVQSNQVASCRPTTETDTPFRRLATGKFPMYYDYSQLSLVDPHNRSSYSMQDLEMAFQTMFAREVDTFCHVDGKRNDAYIIHSLKMLEDMSKQIGKPEYQLTAGILEQMYHSTLKFNPKDLKRILEQNWSLYQNVKRTDKDNLLLFAESEMGAWILTDMSLMEYMTGNFEAAERTFRMARELVRKFGHRGTNHYMLASVAWNLLGYLTLPTAEKVNSIVQGNGCWGNFGFVILGMSLIANGRHKEGLDYMETAVFRIFGNGTESVDPCVVPVLLEAYVQTKTVEKGLSCANYIIKKFNESGVEGSMGKAELLRLRANLLMMKKYPDYVPEPAAVRFVDTAVLELLSVCEPSPEVVKPSYGPLMLQAFLANSPEVGLNEDVEMIFRSAMNLAHIRGLPTIELRCAIDLVRYFLHIGDINQATETVQTVKDCVALMKGPEDTRELQRARYVISLVESTQ